MNGNGRYGGKGTEKKGFSCVLLCHQAELVRSCVFCRKWCDASNCTARKSESIDLLRAFSGICLVAVTESGLSKKGATEGICCAARA